MKTACKAFWNTKNQINFFIKKGLFMKHARIDFSRVSKAGSNNNNDLLILILL